MGGYEVMLECQTSWFGNNRDTKLDDVPFVNVSEVLNELQNVPNIIEKRSEINEALIRIEKESLRCLNDIVSLLEERFRYPPGSPIQLAVDRILQRNEEINSRTFAFLENDVAFIRGNLTLIVAYLNQEILRANKLHDAIIHQSNYDSGPDDYSFEDTLLSKADEWRNFLNRISNLSDQ